MVIFKEQVGRFLSWINLAKDNYCDNDEKWEAEMMNFNEHLANKGRRKNI